MPSRLVPTSIVAQALGAGLGKAVADAAQGAAGGVRYLYKDPNEKGVPALDALVLAGVLAPKYGSPRAVGSFAERDRLRLMVGWTKANGFDHYFRDFGHYERRLAEFESGHRGYQDLIRSRYAGRNAVDLVGKAARSLNSLRLIPYGMVLSEAASVLGKRPRLQAVLDRTVPFVTKVYPSFEVASGLIAAAVPSSALLHAAGPAGHWVAGVMGAVGMLGGLAGVVAMNPRTDRMRGARALAVSGAVASGTFAVYRAVTFVADSVHNGPLAWAAGVAGAATAITLGRLAIARTTGEPACVRPRRGDGATFGVSGRRYRDPGRAPRVGLS